MLIVKEGPVCLCVTELFGAMSLAAHPLLTTH